jgi:hypothetical protein
MVGDDLSAARASLDEAMNGLRDKQKPIGLLEALRNAEPRSFCLSRLPSAGLSDQDAAVLRNFAIQVSDEMDACRKSGRVSDRGLDLIAHNSTESSQALYQQMFKEDA